MTRISVDRVYDTAMQQLGDPCHVSGVAGEKSPDTDEKNPAGMLSGYTIFLDRDGTLNPDPGYIKSPDQFELFPGVAKALASLKRAGARLIVVTNQSGIARGFLSRTELDAIHLKLMRLLEPADASLDAIYFCPHHPDDGCACRKPNRGMIDQAIREWGVDLDRSYLIGDHLRDIELAKRVGVRSILVTTGVVLPQEVEQLKASGSAPDWIASSLVEAADWLLSDVGRRAVERGGRQTTHL